MKCGKRFFLLYPALHCHQMVIAKCSVSERRRNNLLLWIREVPFVKLWGVPGGLIMWAGSQQMRWAQSRLQPCYTRTIVRVPQDPYTTTKGGPGRRYLTDFIRTSHIYRRDVHPAVISSAGVFHKLYEEYILSCFPPFSRRHQTTLFPPLFFFGED